MLSTVSVVMISTKYLSEFLRGLRQDVVLQSNFEHRDLISTGTQTATTQSGSVDKEQLIECAKMHFTHSDIEQLLKNLFEKRKTMIEDELTAKMSKNTKAIEQMGVAHELIFGIGREAIKKRIMENLKDTDRGDQADDEAARLKRALEAHQKKLRKLSRPKLTDEQMCLLFPEDGQFNIDRFDISLLAILAKNITRKCRYKNAWKNDVDRLKDARNKLAHMTTEKIMTFDFEKFLQEMTPALTALGVQKAEIEYIWKKIRISAFFSFSPENFTVELTHPDYGTFRLLPRAGWRAQEPSYPMSPLVTPVQCVVITHTVQDTTSLTTICCCNVKAMQFSDMKIRHFADVGQSYYVGNDGVIYEGRGTTHEGAFAKGWNRKSLGFAFIGTYDDVTLPSNATIDALLAFLEYLVTRGILRTDYELYALRQIRPFPLAPGDALYRLIQTWPHWKKYDGEIPHV